MSRAIRFAVTPPPAIPGVAMIRCIIMVLLACALCGACSDGSSEDTGAATVAAVSTDEATTTTSTVAAPNEAATSTVDETTTTAATTTTATVLAPLEGPRVLENGDFETGDLAGWAMETFRDGEWLIYEDGETRPASTYNTPDHEGVTDPEMEFSLPDPPQGQYAAATHTRYTGPASDSSTGTSRWGSPTCCTQRCSVRTTGPRFGIPGTSI